MLEQSELYLATGEIINKIPVVAVYQSTPQEIIGMSRSDDKKELTPHEQYQRILADGERLAGYDSVRVNDQTEILIFNTSIPAPHTSYVCTYDEFDRHFRSVSQKYGFPLSSDFLIAGNDSTPEEVVPPEYVPLDMCVWLLRKTTDTNGNVLFQPVDIGDFYAPDTGNPEIDKFLLHLGEDTLQEIYEAVGRRGQLATETLLGLYQEVIRKRFPFLPEKKKEDILQGATDGFYRGDRSKKLDQHYYDGLGGGPPSNSTRHYRYQVHTAMDTFNKLNTGSKKKSFEDIRKQMTKDYVEYERMMEKDENGTRIPGPLPRLYLAGDIGLAEMQPDPLDYEDYKELPENAHKSYKVFVQERQAEVIQELLKNYTEEELLKGIDPLASVMHDYLEVWLEDELRVRFARFSPQIKAFRHHATEYDRELRVNEGAEIIISPDGQRSGNELLAQAMTHLTMFIGEKLYPMWNDVKQYVQEKPILSPDDQSSLLEQIKQKYHLPTDVLVKINELLPTEKQLKLLRQRGDLNESQRNSVETELTSYGQKKAQALELMAHLKGKVDAGVATLSDLKRLLFVFQYAQLFDDPELNKGYNIPGVPGTGMTYHFDEKGNFHLLFGWLMSKKGLAEAWLGAMLKRAQRKV
jgi:hypothetical protein